MLFTQVPHTTISCTWRVIRTTRLLINITKIVFLILKWWRCFLWFFYYIGYTILFFPFTWFFCLLNTLFSFDWSVWSIISFILVSNTFLIWIFTWYNCPISRYTIKTWIVSDNIYFVGVLYFGTFIRKNVWLNRPWSI